MYRNLLILLGALACGACQAPEGAGSGGAASAGAPSVRLYVLDGGVLASDPTNYRLALDEVEETSLSVAAYLIVHPRGVLLWDAGAIADSERISREAGVEQRVVRYDGNERFVILAPPLEDQLAESGYSPSDVTHLVLSHYHWDHTANANMFPEALWLVTEAERSRMFAAEPPGGTRGATYHDHQR
jgi:N-acyl homoserine lactone hydrolase